MQFSILILKLKKKMYEHSFLLIELLVTDMKKELKYSSLENK